MTQLPNYRILCRNKVPQECNGFSYYQNHYTTAKAIPLRPNFFVQPILTASACADLTKIDARPFAQLARQIESWAGLSTVAEEQGLAPLLYVHLQKAEIPLPRDLKRELQALYLRHKHANHIRLQTLQELVLAFNEANIQAIVLKGAALSLLVYPEPGLRPMRDLDILVKKSTAKQAQHLLAKLGFDAPMPPTDDLPDKHLAVATRQVEGLTMSIEIHHNLFNKDYPVSLDIESLTAPPLAFEVNGTPAYTLGYEDMLWHLCQHVAYHANVWEPIRLIWVADIVGFAERFASQIDWARLRQQYPLVLNTLSLFHFITPLSETLLRLSAIKIGHYPQGLGEEFQGWPRTSLAQQHAKGLGRILYDSFFPSEWWLRLHYGLDSAQSLFWYRWFRHPFHILGRLKQFFDERVESRK